MSTLNATVVMNTFIIGKLSLHSALRAWVNESFRSQNVDTLTCQPFSCQ
jgi:hypothetical protein